MLLSAITEICCIEQNKFNTVWASIDKLDKESYENIKKELLNKGININHADRILDFCKMNDKQKILLEKLKESNEFMNNLKAKQSLEELEVLFNYLFMLIFWTIADLIYLCQED